MGAEQQRLDDADGGTAPWRRWGPYLSERQWGTVREDYSSGGDAWSYFPHDQARSRAYRWGEDGIAGISDDRQRLCFALALWNGQDAILKERMFGLTNAEGNHGEDVKEYYFYLDNTPTHSYMRELYKYPQRAYPYADLVAENRRRTRAEFEYELLDTGIFNDDRYFDVVVEYAKAGPDDLLVRITAHNRGPDDATLHLLPTLWFRNTWSWGDGEQRPQLWADGGAIVAEHPVLGSYRLACDGSPELLFTENETNTERLFGAPNPTLYVKDGIGRRVVEGDDAAVNPERRGTKAAAYYEAAIPAQQSAVVRLWLTGTTMTGGSNTAFDAQFDAVFADRRAEADEFYDEVLAPGLTDEERRVSRQAFAGMLWTKQYYAYDVEQWLAGHGIDPMSAPVIRNQEWFHMISEDVVSMPDKWEYPWFAAWDLALHAITLSLIDMAYAKEQLDLLLTRLYLHPNGQIPAYEWNFSDVNPPVHAWATYFVYELERRRTGQADRQWLENAFQKLAKNFTWWVNRKDRDGRNLFQGGFLGLDNVGVFDRSAPLPTGGYLDQADGTAWMALYCQVMLQIALELANEDPVYAEQAETFFEHFAWITVAVNHPAADGVSMWDEQDGFFYDLLRLPDGSATRLNVRSMVGLLPLCAATVLPPEIGDRFPHLLQEVASFVERHPVVSSLLAEARTRGTDLQNEKDYRLLSLFGPPRLRRILTRMLDEDEFLSPYGIRSLSRYHAEHPYEFDVHGDRYRVGYLPAESDTGMFGGNSNWRGPVWFPVNALLIRALLNLHVFYGDEFTIECPTGSGQQLTLFEVAREVARRLAAIFLPDEQGHRPVNGGQQKFLDPHWRDDVLFYEYFHGDNGAGIGASHQTGWTGLVAVFLNLFGAVTSAQDFESKFARTRPPSVTT